MLQAAIATNSEDVYRYTIATWLPGTNPMADYKDANNYLVRSTFDILTTYMGDEGAEIARRLERLNAELPPVVGGPGRLRPAEKTISWGITRRKGKFAVAILTERKEVNPILEQIEKDFGRTAIRRVMAQAHSFDPSSAADEPKHDSLPDRMPGASIGHVHGYPGTLGCFVRSHEPDPWVGAISASHVLGRNGKSTAGETILSPGHPDGPKSSDAKIGTLERFIYLTHFEDPSDNYLCCQDVAIVKLSEVDKYEIPEVTWAWCPKEDFKRLFPIKKVIGGREVAERLGQPVYKVGRTTGPTRGILDIVGLQRQPIRIDKRHYIYSNLLAVRCENEPFSKSGDSGALVYTEDGCAIGMVIAGTDQFTFVSPLDACLRDIKATLLQ